MAKKKKTAKKKTTKKKASSSSASKSSIKKAPAKQKKASGKKKTTKKAPAKKKKTAAKKTTKKKSAPKKAAAKKTTTKKSPSKKKSTTKKSETKKSTTKKKTAKSSGETDEKPSADKKKKKKSSQVKITRGKSVVEVATTAAADAQGYVIINGRRVRMISTKGLVKPKKKVANSVAEAQVDEKEKIKKIKTKLGKKELDHYRKLLLIKRAEIVGDLNSLEAEALRSDDGDVSSMPIHMADLGSDTYEQDFMLGMAESERQRLREIDDALKRITEKTYGICQMTGKPIPKARLEAKPWAKYTIEAARQLEGSWGA